MSVGYPQGDASEHASELGCDASAVVAIANSRASFKSSLFLARRADFLQRLADKVRVVKIDGAEIRADILTKVVSTAVFTRLRHFILNVRHRASDMARCLVSWVRCPD